MQVTIPLLKEKGLKVQTLELEKFWSECPEINLWFSIEGLFDIELWQGALNNAREEVRTGFPCLNCTVLLLWL